MSPPRAIPDLNGVGRFEVSSIETDCSSLLKNEAIRLVTLLPMFS